MKASSRLLSSNVSYNRILLLIISMLILIIIIQNNKVNVSIDDNSNNSNNDMINDMINNDKSCEDNMSSKYQSYMIAMDKIYSNVNIQRTCYASHKQCGWPRTSINNNDNNNNKKELPLLVLSIGLEGSGNNNTITMNLITINHYASRSSLLDKSYA